MKASTSRLVLFIAMTLPVFTGFLNAALLPLAHAQDTQEQLDAGVDARQARERWKSMSESEKQRIRENYRRWQGMSEEERSDLKGRYQLFRALPVDKKAKLIQQHKRFKSLPEEKQQKIRENFRKFRKLPQAERTRRVEGLRARRQSRIQDGGASASKRDLPAAPQRRRQR